MRLIMHRSGCHLGGKCMQVINWNTFKWVFFVFSFAFFLCSVDTSFFVVRSVAVTLWPKVFHFGSASFRTLKKAWLISVLLPLPTPHHQNFVKCSLYRWDRGWGPVEEFSSTGLDKQPQELMELLSEVVFFFFFQSLDLQHFDLHTNNNYCSVCQYTWVHLDQAWANYGQEAICATLGFLIWPAQLEEMVLTLSKS